MITYVVLVVILIEAFYLRISLDLNQLIKDDTNIKFEYKARYLMKYLDIRYIT
ncbi:hypothetical protein [Clostridium sporogenes]|uniref:hypothetical protein n=1 Tax=Clostridium sporogenes TaxID=1509 RepID=UPI0020A19156|nr:hypothetical protein [Clostridium sporogenes]